MFLAISELLLFRRRGFGNHTDRFAVPRGLEKGAEPTVAWHLELVWNSVMSSARLYRCNAIPSETAFAQGSIAWWSLWRWRQWYFANQRQGKMLYSIQFSEFVACFFVFLFQGAGISVCLSCQFHCLVGSCSSDCFKALRKGCLQNLLAFNVPRL